MRCPNLYRVFVWFLFGKYVCGRDWKPSPSRPTSKTQLSPRGTQAKEEEGEKKLAERARAEPTKGEGTKNHCRKIPPLKQSVHPAVQCVVTGNGGGRDSVDIE